MSGKNHHQSKKRHPVTGMIRALLAAGFLLAAMASNLSAQQNALFHAPYSDIDAHIEALLAAMSDEQRAAQVLMVGWPSVEPSPELMRWIRERNIGSIKIFGWNGGDVPAMASAIATMQNAARNNAPGIPLFTATDQEGGWVRHIKDLTSITPGNMAIGASGTASDAYQSGVHIAGELQKMGVNMNLAPTVDVYSHPEAHVIGPRSFGDDPRQTGLLGAAFFRGHQRQGVVATGKHFPGHGGIPGDSHLLLPTSDIGFERLWERDLLPFRILISEGIPALLSGHLSFPKVTGDTTPASFSTWFNKKLLRERMGYTGIIITDDLYMYGAIDYGQTHGESIADMVVRSIRSGSDMIMLSSTPEFNGDIWNTLIATYKSDPDFRQVLDAAVRRILRVKLEYLHDDVRQVPLQPNASNLRNELPSNATRQFFMEQALRSVSLIGDTLPTIKEGDRVLLAGHNYAFFRIGREFFPGVSEYRFQNRNFYFSTSRDREAMVEMAEQYDVILFALSDPNSAQVLQELKEYKDKIIVFSLLSPIYLTTMPWVQNGIAVFGWYDDSVRAGYSVLTGFAPAIGSMPINIENSRKPQ